MYFTSLNNVIISCKHLCLYCHLHAKRGITSE